MYQYYDLDDTRFENLVLAICEELLGLGVQGFAKGADGGKDGKFVGTAKQYPSENNAWNGTIIIQAKHTTGVNKHFKDTDFYSKKSKTNILAKEVAKIKKMVEKGTLNYYMLFANRSLAGGAEEEIKAYIAQNTGLDIQNIALFSNDDLDRLLRRYKDIPTMEGINLTPLNNFPILNYNSLAEIIGYLADVFNVNHINEHKEIIRTHFHEKNQLNNFREDTANYLTKQYMKYMGQIQQFLNDPQNINLKEHYENTVVEFQIKYIIPEQRKLNYFDDIFNSLVDYLVYRGLNLSVQVERVKLVRLMVFYMYWNCDIGKSNDDSSE